jgi:alanine racemase
MSLANPATAAPPDEAGAELTRALAVSEKAAGAILSINLKAIERNYRFLRERMGRADCAAVLKADAYGLGASRVATVLSRAGCRSFFVAHLNEAVELRSVLGPGASIYILNGLSPGAEDECVTAGAIPVLNSPEQISSWRAASRSRGRRLPAAIQTDSGMSRLGLSHEDVRQLASDLKAFDDIDVRLLLSHLACAERKTHMSNRAQLYSFELARALLPRVPASFANSSGIFIGPEFHFDLGRPGAALYGLNPDPAGPNVMLPVVQMSAKVIQTRELQSGDAVGYGNSFRATGPMRIAAISLGYADGWPRSASEGAAAYFEGIRLPFVGRVSMDTITIDVSELSAGALKPGSLVELINEMQTVDHVAHLAGTIGYEILTGLGRRFHRKYADG